MQRHKSKLKAQIESNLTYFSFKALGFRRFQRGLHRLNLHRPTSI